MKIIHVIPITRAIGKEVLSYFSSRDIPAGSVVSIPLRKRGVPALVVASESAAHAKASIKRADFAYRKIGAQKPRTLISPHAVHAAAKTAEYFCGSTGAVLHACIPSAILEDVKKMYSLPVAERSPEVVHEKIVLQSPPHERLDVYRSLVREEFARGASVFIAAPTITESRRLHEELRKGIERRTFLLNGSLAKKEIRANWRNALDEAHPILVVGTPKFLSLPRHDIRTIIVEREQTSAYKTFLRPHYDFRVFAEFLARESGARIVFADFPLRAETLWRFEKKELEEMTPLKFRIPASQTEERLFDMREAEDGTDVSAKKTFRVLHPAVHANLKNAQERGERVFLYTARRGLSSMTVCSDCGNTVACAICAAPVVLHKAPEENIFICHICGAARSAKECCANCTSWKLTSLGVGIQRLGETLKKYVPEKQILTIDHDTTTTHKQVRDAVRKFYDTPGVVLIGTEMALLHLDRPIEHVAVVSVDSLLMLPEWRISEKLFAMLITMKYLAKKTFYIQTRKPSYVLLTHALRGTINEFYREEIAARKTCNYPPFSVLVKISATGSLQCVTTEMKNLESLLEAYALHVYYPASSVGGGRYALHGLIRVPRGEWPHTKLIATLRTLPARIDVTVDPINLF